MEPGSFASFLRLKAPVYFAIAVVSGVLLFGSRQVLESIGLQAIVDQYRGWIGVIFLVATALAIAQVVSGIWKFYRAKTRRAELRSAQERQAEQEAQRNRDTADRRKQLLIDQLSNLTSDEKAMLRPFVQLDIRSRRIEMNHGTLKALCGAHILNMPSQVVSFEGDGYEAEIFIQPWAMEHLKKHPELLQ